MAKISHHMEWVMSVHVMKKDNWCECLHKDFVRAGVTRDKSTKQLGTMPHCGETLVQK